MTVIASNLSVATRLHIEATPASASCMLPGRQLSIPGARLPPARMSSSANASRALPAKATYSGPVLFRPSGPYGHNNAAITPLPSSPATSYRTTRAGSKPDSSISPHRAYGHCRAASQAFAHVSKPVGRRHTRILSLDWPP